MTSVLLIDDNGPIRMMLVEILNVAGYDVLEAADGAEGWKLATSRMPDIILSDIRMPEMDGFELLERIRGHQKTEAMPFIFLSSLSEREDIRKGMAMGADDFISKPFTSEEITEAIRGCLLKRQKIDHKHDSTIRLLRKSIAYSLPHELRTPLMNVMGYSQMMMMDYETLSRDDFRNMSETIFRSGQRLNHLVENSLVYAQIELIASDPEQVQALRNHLLKSATKIIRQVAENVAENWERLDDLYTKLEDRALQISADNLGHIIEEIVDNAFKFSDLESPVMIKSLVEDGYFKIMIRDIGRGITDEQLAQIGAYMQFERMVYEQQGVGMGLTIAKRLVELHDGELLIDNTESKGTTVTVQFPV